MFIGIDGGGTKTKMVLYDEECHSLKELVLPTVHILTQSKDKCIEILREGVEQLDPQGICKIGIGLAGYGQNKELRKEIEDICYSAFYPRTYVLESDVRIALEGALNGQDGIVVIAGTGSIAFSLCNGTLKRCGGWGYQLGDEASAYWIVKRMFSIYCQEVDGRLPQTKLYELIKTECHLENDYDIITYMNHHDHTQIASLAYINTLAAKEKDPHALSIYKEAAQELYKLIVCLSNDFIDPIQVSYIGGVLEHAGEYIIPYLKVLLGNQYNVIPPVHTPEYGAYRLIEKMK